MTDKSPLAAPSKLPSQGSSMAFTNKYHADTVAQKKGARQQNGSVMTVNATGVVYNGKIYTVPGYDRETGQRMTPDEALERFKPDIEAGRVAGLPLDLGKDMRGAKHLANVYARENHKNVEAPEEAIGYDFSQKKSLGEL